MTTELVTDAVSFVSLRLKAVPEHFDYFIDTYIMSGQFAFVELVVELIRIELLPIHQRMNRRGCTSDAVEVLLCVVFPSRGFFAAGALFAP